MPHLIEEKKKPSRFKGFWKRMWQRIKDMCRELKNVTWPTFPKVMKQTGVVFAVVMFFLIIIFAFDLGLSQMYRELIKQIAGT